MTAQFRVEHNLETGEITQIDLTDEEILYLQNIKARIDAEKEIEIAKTAQREAILDRLGLTADEAQILLGGN